MGKTKCDKNKNISNKYKGFKKSDENVQSKILIKQKKFFKNVNVINFSEEEIAEKEKNELDNNIKYYDSDEFLTKPKKSIQNHEMLDMSLDVISHINDDSLNPKKLKKKKKHDNDLSSKDFAASNNAEKNIFDENEVVLDNDISYSKQRITPKKEKKNHKLLDTTMHNTCNINDESFKSKKPKKKKKHDNSCFMDFVTNHVEGNGRESIEVNNYCSNESVNTEKEHHTHELLNTSLDNFSNINDESLNPKKLKKKKKHDNDLSSKDFAATNNAEKNIFDENEVVLDNDISYSKECVTTENENENHKLLDTTLHNTCNINDESFKSKKPKKKKKHDNSCFMDFATNHIEGNGRESIEVNNYCSNASVNTENEHQNHELLNTSLDHFSNVNDESLKPKKLKKKKHDNDLSLKDFAAINNAEKNIFDRNEVLDNDISYSKECVTTENENENHKLLDTTLHNTCNINDESSKSKKPIKKTEHDNSCLMDFAANHVEGNGRESNEINNYCSNVSVNTENEHQNHELLNTSLDHFSNVNDESLKPKKLKKKKHDNDLSLKDFAAINNAEKNIFDGNEVVLDNDISYSKDCVTTENENKNHKLLDTTLHNTCNINDESYKSKESNKKKKHENSFIDFVSDYAEKNTFEENEGVFIDDISNLTTNELANKKKENLNHELLRKPSDNIASFSNENFDLKKTKTKRKYDKNIHSLDFIIDGKKKKRNNSTNKVIEEFANIIEDIKSIQQNVIISDDNNTVQNVNESSKDYSNNLVSIDGKHNSYLISDADNTIVDQNISQENFELEALLSAINLPGLDNSSSSETQVPLDVPKLINAVINNKLPLQDQHSDLIVKKFTSELKKILVNISVTVLPSEMILLNIIGEKVLALCVERQKHFEIVKNVHIIVPSESKNNKIHYAETTLTKYPNNTIIAKMKNLNPSIKLGAFNEQEDDIIKKNWFKFQQEYNISDVQPFLSNGLDIVIPSSERLPFARYISVGLPNRILYSVYYRFVVLFDKRIVDKISFRKEEDKLIMQVNDCAAIRNKYMVLNLLLNRSKQQLIRRLNSLKLQPSCKERIIWSIEKRQELFSSILLETNTKNWTDLENLKIKKRTWIKVAKRFSVPISDEKLRVQWKFLSTMLFCKRPIYYSTFKLTILKLLLQKNVKYWSDISWPEITAEFYPGASSKVIYTIFNWWVVKKVPAELRSNVRGTLKYLATVLDSDIKKLNEDRIYYFPMFTVTENNELKLK